MPQFSKGACWEIKTSEPSPALSYGRVMQRLSQPERPIPALPPPTCLLPQQPPHILKVEAEEPSWMNLDFSQPPFQTVEEKQTERVYRDTSCQSHHLFFLLFRAQ